MDHDAFVDALQRLRIPAYALDADGIIRWQNQGALETTGDLRGRHFTRVIAPEDRAVVQDEFTRKILGTAEHTEFVATVLTAGGERVTAEFSSVPLRTDERVVGAFGVAITRSGDPTKEPPPHLTPRQYAVLRELAAGCGTEQIASRLGIAPETVRNHIRRLLRAMGVHSRLEAVVRAHELDLI